METKYPQLDFSSCSAEWDYEPNTTEAAIIRAENVRKALSELPAHYKDIAIVTHRGFITYLVPGERFEVCDNRSYRFADDAEIAAKRFEWNVDTGREQDYGPTRLMKI